MPASLSLLELLAVVLALAYLLLAIRQNAWCWPAAILSAGLYLKLMFEAGLYLQSVLQVFYVGMALYGWWHWRGGPTGASVPVVSWSLRQHVIALLVITVPGILVGLALGHYTDSEWPYIDALTAWGAVITTWMVARKVLQNWHYWFVIDAVLVFVYFSQGLRLTAGLFVLYLLLVVIGYRQWLASMRLQAASGR